MAIDVSICAHPARLTQAQHLATTLDGHISVDDGIGILANHDRALAYLADSGSEWAIILEDDAQPIPDFINQAEAALTHCPTNVASLYLGRNYPTRGQTHIRSLLEHDPHWIVHHQLRHAVAVAIRPTLIPHLLAAVKDITHLPADYRWGAGLQHLHEPIAYSNPSLVNHHDNTPVITTLASGQPRTRTQPRTAWHAGTRDTWTSSHLTL